MKKSFTFNLIEQDNKKIVVLEGNLTLNNIPKIQSRLSSLLTSTEPIEIVTANVENMDLSFIQLLYSACKTRKIENREVSLKVCLPEEIRVLCSRAGFNDVLNNNIISKC